MFVFQKFTIWISTKRKEKILFLTEFKEKSVIVNNSFSNHDVFV